MPRSQNRRRPADPRPYIRDVSRQPQGAIDVATVTVGMVALALGVGFIVGLAVFGLMNLSTWLTNLIWNGGRSVADVPWFSLAVCTIGGAVIGLWTWWSNDRVKPLEEVMATFKATGSFKTNGAIRPVVWVQVPLRP